MSVCVCSSSVERYTQTGWLSMRLSVGVEKKPKTSSSQTCGWLVYFTVVAFWCNSVRPDVNDLCAIIRQNTQGEKTLIAGFALVEVFFVFLTCQLYSNLF